MTLFSKALQSKTFFWLILMIPAIPMMALLVQNVASVADKTVYEFLLHPTGEFAARFMIIAMILSPMRMLFPKNKFWAYFMKRRRYLGVAAFIYGLLHTIFYLVDAASLTQIVTDFGKLGIWSAWLAFFVFIPLAVTSNNWSVRRMGSSWKTLQRFVYVAAIATLIHWMFIHYEFGAALVHFVPLALLELFRLLKHRQRKSLKV